MSSRIAATSFFSATTSPSNVTTRWIGTVEEAVVVVEAKGKETLPNGLGGRFSELVEADASATRALFCRRGDWWRCAGEARAGERRAGFGDVARTDADLCADRDDDLAATDRAGDAARVVFVDLDLLTAALGTSASTAAPADA